MTLRELVSLVTGESPGMASAMDKEVVFLNEDSDGAMELKDHSFDDDGKLVLSFVDAE